MASYKQLSALPALAYLNPENFRTEYDNLPEDDYRVRQYQKGRKYGEGGTTLYISVESVWSVDGYNGNGFVSSSEGIGYHSCTADLLRGFLDSGIKIVVIRRCEYGVTETVIKEGKI